MVTLQNLMTKLLAGTVQSNENTEKVIVRIYPQVYKTANLGLVSRILEKESYILLLDIEGNRVTIINFYQYYYCKNRI